MKPENDSYLDELALLARVDPEAFELRRHSAIDEMLQSSSKQKMLKKLQREIDAVRNQAGNPQAALLAITRMLDEHVIFLAEELKAQTEFIDTFRQ